MRMMELVLAALVAASPAIADDADHKETRFAGAGVSRTRALAMGGAYHSVTDDFTAGFYNPAAFHVNRIRTERRFTLFLNPVATSAAIAEYRSYDRDFIRDDELTPEESLYALTWLVKGAVITTQALDMGVALGEELLDPLQTISPGRAISFQRLDRASMHAGFVNLKLSTTISLGLAGTLYRIRTDDETDTRSGFSFGVQMNPNPRLHVGVVYHEIPEEVSLARYPLESIEGGTVTGGVSYYPDTKTVLSIDIRNLNKEDKLASREIHTGFERTIAGRIALRGGYYRKKLTDHDVYSVGVGLLPAWERITRFETSSRSDLLSYTFVAEEGDTTTHWHLWSLLMRF